MIKVTVLSIRRLACTRHGAARPAGVHATLTHKVSS